MKPITRLAIVLCVTIAICQVTYTIMSKGLRKYNIHTTQRLTELFERNTNYNLLFIGSSRTHSNINPFMVDSICNMNSYNAGVEGGNLLEFKMTFDAYLENHPAPELLVLTLDLSSFDLSRKFFNYTQYFPFINNRIIDSTLSKNGHNTWPIKIAPFLEFIDYDDFLKGNALKGITGAGGNEIPPGDFQYKGYLSNTNHAIIVSDTIQKVSTLSISDTAINYLNQIIKKCKEKQIKTIFTYAPEYQKELQKHISNATEIFTLISKIANDNGIPYLRDDSLAICKDSKLFVNPGHLNTNGAAQYSSILGKKICNLYKN
jgi:hypothetical protein